MRNSKDLIGRMLRARLGERGTKWLDEREAELAGGVEPARFATLIALASRFAPRGPLTPDDTERAAAGEALEGWNPERWTTLEALRLALVLAHPEPESDGLTQSMEEAFRFADEGELCALYRSLAHLPLGERFAWRSGEGCRTNMLTVFEANACDTPYPFHHLGEVAWNQMVVKSLFVGAPAWRIWGLDKRLTPELARMVLDLCDERRSAGRAIPPELWACLGEHGGERGNAALEQELAASNTLGARAAVLGFVRAGREDRVRELLAGDPPPDLRATAEAALSGSVDQTAFAPLVLESNA